MLTLLEVTLRVGAVGRPADGHVTVAGTLLTQLRSPGCVVRMQRSLVDTSSMYPKGDGEDSSQSANKHPPSTHGRSQKGH